MVAFLNFLILADELHRNEFHSWYLGHCIEGWHARLKSSSVEHIFLPLFEMTPLLDTRRILRNSYHVMGLEHSHSCIDYFPFCFTKHEVDQGDLPNEIVLNSEHSLATLAKQQSCYQQTHWLGDFLRIHQPASLNENQDTYILIALPGRNAFSFLKTTLSGLSHVKTKQKILVRLHPYSKQTELGKIIKDFGHDLNIEIDHQVSLERAIELASVIVTSQSSVGNIALNAGRINLEYVEPGQLTFGNDHLEQASKPGYFEFSDSQKFSQIFSNLELKKFKLQHKAISPPTVEQLVATFNTLNLMSSLFEDCR